MQGFDEEKKEIIKEFVNETRDRLDDAEPKIIQLEKTALESGKVDSEILNDIFRLFHTLKSNSAFFELHTISEVMHEAETLLDIFRKEKALIAARHVDIIYKSTDFIKTSIAGLETEISDEGLKAPAAALIKEIKEEIKLLTPDEKEGRANIDTDKKQIKSEKKEKKSEEKKGKDADGASPGLIDAAIAEQFASSAVESMDRARECLKKIASGTAVIESAELCEREFHTVKGNAGFMGLPEIERAARCGQEAAESILEKGFLPEPKLAALMGRLCDVVKVMARSINDNSGRQNPNTANLINAIEDIAANSEADVKKAAGRAAKELSAAAAEAKQAAAAAGLQTSIRVDVEKLDMLLDLVGELVISEAMVINNPELSGFKSEKFEKSLLHMDKITRDIQEISMSMRMIPLAATFNKMPRIVRDIAYKTGKKAAIEIIGEETEVDKTIIELINDPLVHIIRNSVDHGIETPSERQAAGKEAEGLIKVEAKHSAGEVWITVEDDGRGLSRKKILEKAISRGLVDAKKSSDIPDREVWQIIFMPGFSTAEMVSDISGRGVGLDVVRRNIEKMRGKVDVKTIPGKGTAFVIRIPLTLAIIEGMVVKVGLNRYTIPISSIRNTFRPKQEMLTQLPGRQEVVNMRGMAVPVVRLHSVYNVKPVYENLTEGLLVFVENEDKHCCLFVDELVGQQQIVIKGLSAYLGRVRGISGCAILGDGDISMILDIAELIKSVEEEKTETAGRR